MLVGLLVLVGKYNRSYPYADELFYLTTPLTPGWLWAQHAEHRIPLAKLIWLGVLKLTNYDFRIANWLSVLALAGMTVALIQTATKLRGGRLSIFDAFLPLAIFNFGQALNLVWWWQVNHLIAPLLATAFLILILLKGKQLTFRHTIVAGACLLLLCVAGPGGLPYVLALGMWLAYRAILFWQSSSERDGKRKAVLLFSVVVLAFASVGLYFVGYAPVDWTTVGVAEPDLPTTLKAALQVMTVSLGPAVAPYWKYASIAVLALLLLCLAALVAAWRRRPDERFRVVGLLLFIGAMAPLFLVVGHSRAGLGQEYLQAGHYFNLAVPALYFAYLVCLVYTTPAVQRLVQIGLLSVTCALCFQNFEYGRATAAHLRSGQADFETDMQAGLPPVVLADRHVAFLNTALAANDRTLGGLLDGMRQAGIPQFAQTAPNPTYREEAVPVSPLASRMLGEASIGEPTHPADVSRLDFEIGQPRFVYAIRLVGVYGDQTTRSVQLRLLWSGGATNRERTDAVQLQVDPNDNWARRGDRVNKKTVTMWVNDVLDRFSIIPDDEPTEFQVSEIVLLVPTTAPEAEPHL